MIKVACPHLLFYKLCNACKLLAREVCRFGIFVKKSTDCLTLWLGNIANIFPFNNSSFLVSHISKN